ncbi:hemolysin activation/secretion protein [Xenococcus sp. PCC 7305]|uniref:ShlB/FhaC/HecB family hemolysin secretion/activation protein n=1 Tax=Xenococcus sp. PCC 7305 TaxID=102125 RepID=UPI0002ACD32C|nr:ShlB/FhaC/HecB family hemolysin secretion/activation protein [Xenococcus sp. PCC 7305]ELS04517.1 hemolysin activation/secretion protein [Xenococcus sp. PCC 7305]
MKQKYFPLIKDIYSIVLFGAIAAVPVSLIVIAGTGKNVLAQIDTTIPRDQLDQLDRIPPGSLPRNDNDSLITPRETLPPLEDLIETPQIPSDLEQGDPNLLFEVKGFLIKDNTAFSDQEIQDLLVDYVNAAVSFADLLQVETIVAEKYKDAGYINSGAVVPVQSVENGIVTVQVIEGTIERLSVQVKGGRLSEKYISSRLERGTKTPFNLNELQEALQLLQLNPLIENLNAELSVGTRRDRWLLDIEVNQANAFEPVIFANNSRTPSVGSFQRGIEINHNNFAGLADRLSLIYKNTDGSNDYNFDYNVPFNSLDGSFGVRYRYITSEIIEPPFDDLDIESRTDEFEVVVRQPIILSATPNSTQEMALGLEFSRQANETELLGQPFPLSPGATDDGKTRINAIRFFQDWTRRTRRDVLAARSQFNFGLDIFDSTINDDGPDGEFFSWRGQAQWLKLINSQSNINFLLRSDIQVSNNELVPLEQFSLGGIDTVRGYRQDSLLGDSGLLVSAELRVPVLRWNNRQSSVAVIPFADFGTVWGEQELPNQDEDTVASLGVGLQLLLDERLRARIDWGIPLVEVEDRDRTLQEDGLYFSLEYFPF